MQLRLNIFESRAFAVSIIPFFPVNLEVFTCQYQGRSFEPRSSRRTLRRFYPSFLRAPPLGLLLVHEAGPLPRVDRPADVVRALPGGQLGADGGGHRGQQVRGRLGPWDGRQRKEMLFHLSTRFYYYRLTIGWHMT